MVYRVLQSVFSAMFRGKSLYRVYYFQTVFSQLQPKRKGDSNVAWVKGSACLDIIHHSRIIDVMDEGASSIRLNSSGTLASDLIEGFRMLPDVTHAITVHNIITNKAGKLYCRREGLFAKEYSVDE